MDVDVLKGKEPNQVKVSDGNLTRCFCPIARENKPEYLWHVALLSDLWIEVTLAVRQNHPYFSYRTLKMCLNSRDEYVIRLSFFFYSKVFNVLREGTDIMGLVFPFKTIGFSKSISQNISSRVSCKYIGLQHSGVFWSGSRFCSRPPGMSMLVINIYSWILFH